MWNDDYGRVCLPVRDIMIVADPRHHQFMPDVAGSGVEEEPFLERKNFRVEVPTDRQLAAGGPQMRQRNDLGHAAAERGLSA